MIIAILIFFLFLFLSTPSSTIAVCPVCTIAIGTGVGLSRWLGIDDTISGLWIGGFILSSAFWISSLLDKKNISFPYKTVVFVLLFYTLTVIFLYLSGLIGATSNSFLGVDKLLFGTTIGSLSFIISVILEKYLRIVNNGKVYIYYQKIILPVSFLTIISVFLFFITK